MKTSESKYNACMYFATNALARKMEKMAIDCWSRVDLAPSHAYLMMLVVEQPGIQPSIIGGHLRLTPSTITRLIEKLEEKKLVIRISEGKLTNVYPTPKGKELYPELLNCAREFTDQYYELLGKEESDRLARHLTKIADKLLS